MAAATGNLLLPDFPLASLPILVAASTTIYQYTHVCFNGSGYAVPGADTSGYVYAGMSITSANNAGGAAGAIGVSVSTPAVAPYKGFNATGADQTWVGARVFLADDNSVTKTTGSNHICAGLCVAIGGSANIPSGMVMVDTTQRFVPAAT